MDAKKRIAVDVMGGDLGCEVAVRGAVKGAKDFDIPVLLVGNESEILPVLKSMNVAQGDLIKVEHAPDVITMEDSPSLAIRGKRKASVRVAFECIKEGKAYGMMGPGNTGALMASGLSVCGTLAGIQRPAIATAIPRVNNKPIVLLDSGANVDCNRNQLVTFALMGSVYAKVALKIQDPKVALVSNGGELCKGTDLLRSTALHLSKNKEINFVGYVEGKNIFGNDIDVAVCDGFVGNIMLKTIEGMVFYLGDMLKASAKGHPLAGLGMLIAKPVVKTVFRDLLNTPECSAAPLLGLNYPAVVLHGASKEPAFRAGLKATSNFVEGNILDMIKDSIMEADFETNAGFDSSVWKEIEENLKRKKS